MVAVPADRPRSENALVDGKREKVTEVYPCPTGPLGLGGLEWSVSSHGWNHKGHDLKQKADRDKDKARNRNCDTERPQQANETQ